MQKETCLERIAERERDMITPIGTMTINQICERTGDLLVSADDVQEIAKKARERAIKEFAERMKDSLIHNYRHLLITDVDDFEWLTIDAVNTHIENVVEQMIADMKNR